MTHIIIPGSFDPMTLGHVDLIERAVRTFGRVTVVVMDNFEKTYLFSTEERVGIAQSATKHLTGVDVISSHEMLYEFCRRTGLFTVCKGIRNAEDLDWENRQAVWNHEQENRIETVYLPASDSFREFSSTRARRAIEAGEDITPWVGKEAAGEIKKIIKNRT